MKYILKAGQEVRDCAAHAQIRMKIYNLFLFTD